MMFVTITCVLSVMGTVRGYPLSTGSFETTLPELLPGILPELDEPEIQYDPVCPLLDCMGEEEKLPCARADRCTPLSEIYDGSMCPMCLKCKDNPTDDEYCRPKNDSDDATENNKDNVNPDEDFNGGNNISTNTSGEEPSTDDNNINDDSMTTSSTTAGLYGETDTMADDTDTFPLLSSIFKALMNKWRNPSPPVDEESSECPDIDDCDNLNLDCDPLEWVYEWYTYRGNTCKMCPKCPVS